MSNLHWHASADDCIRELIEWFGPDADYALGQAVFTAARKAGAIYYGTIPGAAQLNGYRYTENFNPADYLPRGWEP
jgi:hypothetical protein